MVIDVPPSETGGLNATDRADVKATIPVIVGAPALAKNVTVVALEDAALKPESAALVAVTIHVPAAVALKLDPDTEQPDAVPFETE